MSKAEASAPNGGAKRSPVLGLDIGTSRIVLSWKDSEHYSYNSQLNAFVAVPYTRMTENALRREGVPFEKHDTELVVLGNEAPRFADLLNVEMRRPMVQGVLNPAEVESIPVIRNIIETMVNQADSGKPKVYFSVPSAPLHGEEGLTYHEATLRQMFAEMKYPVQVINEGLAVVYSELEDTNFTGIGISCGGGLCNVCLAYLSMPAFNFSVPKAGDFIDASVAGVTGDLSNRVRISKEDNFHFNGAYPDKLHQVIAVYYDDMIQSLINGMKDAFSNTKKMPKLTKPIPIVLSGGTASPKGFRDRFEKLLRATDFPIQISEIRLARNPMTATAKGALVAGLAETEQ
jgi:hypothetical protein